MTAIPTATVTAVPSVAFVCIIQTAEQAGTDFTPETIVYGPMVDSARCASLLAKDNSDGKSTIISVMPTGQPVCSGTVGDVTLAIYGTSVAKLACSLLGLK